MASMFRSSVSSGSSSDDDHAEVSRKALEMAGDQVLELEESEETEELEEDEDSVGEDDAGNGQDQHTKEVSSSENGFENGAGPLARLNPLNRDPEHHSA